MLLNNTLAGASGLYLRFAGGQCDLFRGSGKDEQDRKLLAEIEQFGWHVVGIEQDDERPGFVSPTCPRAGGPNDRSLERDGLGRKANGTAKVKMSPIGAHNG